MPAKSYRDLDVWQKSIALVTAVYAATKSFPKDELYALTNQIRRAAVSVPSNIAEGRAKRTTREFMRFVNIASGSIAELETQLIIGVNLGYLSNADAKPLMDEAENIGRMLNGLYTALKRKLSQTPDPKPQTPSS